MPNLLTFKKSYFLLTLLLFAIEVLIALFVKDRFIRPYVGDVLVVILIYCFVKSFLNLSVGTVAVAVLVFSFAVEFAQYFQIVEVLGLQDNKIARIVIGTSFSWKDLVAYTVGIILVLCIEKFVLDGTGRRRLLFP